MCGAPDKMYLLCGCIVSCAHAQSEKDVDVRHDVDDTRGEGRLSADLLVD